MLRLVENEAVITDQVLQKLRVPNAKEVRVLRPEALPPDFSSRLCLQLGYKEFCMLSAKNEVSWDSIIVPECQAILHSAEQGESPHPDVTAEGLALALLRLDKRIAPAGHSFCERAGIVGEVTAVKVRATFIKDAIDPRRFSFGPSTLSSPAISASACLRR